jgi:hypothetical protein
LRREEHDQDEDRAKDRDRYFGIASAELNLFDGRGRARWHQSPLNSG